MEKWIWLDPAIEKDHQLCPISAFSNEKDPRHRYAVAEFKRTYRFDQPIVRAELRLSADTIYRLWANDTLIAQGPVSAGGDFDCSGAMPYYFASRYVVENPGDSIEFFAQVRLFPVKMLEFSCGRGGFMLEGTLIFEDGTTAEISTDESWQTRRNPRFSAPHTYDESLLCEKWHTARITENVWTLKDASIPNLWEGDILPEKHCTLRVPAGETIRHTFTFDKIYAAYYCLNVSGACDIKTYIKELPENGGEKVSTRFAGAAQYRSLSMYSTGIYDMTIENLSDAEITVEAHARMCCYPVDAEGFFNCSDPELKKVYDVCKWTLQNCRQTIHLDSMSHQEPLACTGDYYIESLMTAFTFGDMRLAEMDVLRTAYRLESNGGVMFHTSYSLIWVMMLWDVYRFTGNRSLLTDCLKALALLLDRFESYLGDNGLIENPPDFMFLDWLVVDGHSLHHPPKSLGQTALNAFYHGALKTAEKIYTELSLTKDAEKCAQSAAALKQAFNAILYDSEKQLYFDGLSSPQDEKPPFRPKNVALYHFSRHANTLAVLFDLCEGEEAVRILRRILHAEELQQVQPYFMHFVLEAVAKTGLFPEYGMEIMEIWKPVVAECDKGLAEGWFKPEETYSFDHSHAWGGTPCYQLPQQLLGFRMEKPGFEEISLYPQLFTLDWFRLSMPTPKGMLCVSMQKGKPPVIHAPKDLNWSLRTEA